MNLGILLSFGSSLNDQKKSGQDERFIKYYLEKYNKAFSKVYVFSYLKEKYSFPKNCFLIANKRRLNRFIYSLLLPFIQYKDIKKIDVFRVMQMTGTVPAILTKIFFNKPFVFTYGYDYIAFARLEGQTIRPILLKILERLAMKFASGIIVTNKIIEVELKKKYSKAKLFYIPNGVDVDKFKPASPNTNHPRILRGRQSLITNLLFVGRLEKQKNLANLIKAISLLKKKYQIKLTFIGQGRLKLQLIKLAKRLNVNLRIIGMVSHLEMPPYYQRADIFVLPSFLEGNPKALLEAMACGLPCLTAEYSGLLFENKKEVLLTGFSQKEIAKNLEQLIKDNDLRKTLSINARRRIERDFNIKKLLEKEIKSLQSIKSIENKAIINSIDI